eukprot:CAMPEP_0184868496 /NCGR_PEP_ID=MMETSP0580-20130426/30633_1 /TAXON_ID=1118495 /ORGANISM="Dactyliosolen fragilissimus" /LENGTH=76 /DNA_ID=CAMNT_0027369425 /DNA_START=8 /DNA_END=235 /DNA_ORIENTATION=-
MNLPQSHPLHAYIDDTRQCIELLHEQPHLWHCEEFAFLRKAATFFHHLPLPTYPSLTMDQEIHVNNTIHDDDDTYN